MRVDIRHTDALDLLRSLPDASVDALVTDPPSGIAFMSRAWDRHDSYEPQTGKGKDAARFLSALGLKAWEVGFVAFIADVMSQCLRVLKPGGHGLVWALPRTSDLTCLGLRLAGWEVRDCLTHLYGSGFPKSLDVSKAIDGHLGAEGDREVVGLRHRKATGRAMQGEGVPAFAEDFSVTLPATDEAKRWEGWGTAAKPSSEHWWLIRKPLSGTVASNVLEWGVGGLNVDGCRVEGSMKGAHYGGRQTASIGYSGTKNTGFQTEGHSKGRWPPNTLLTHSPDCTESACVEGCVVVELGVSSTVASMRGERHGNVYGGGKGPSGPSTMRGHADTGTAARYFPQFRYVPKPSRAERERGCEHLKLKQFKIKDGLTDEERAMVLARLKTAGVEI